MSKFTEGLQLSATTEMKERAEEAADNGYGSQAEYVRDMWLAGESVVGDLDPRVGDSGQHNTEIDSPEAAAKALSDGAILSELSDEKRAFGDVVEQLTQQFENVLADRLYEKANEEHSAVETDGRGNYWLDK
jgi:hypothetical protein